VAGIRALDKLSRQPMEVLGKSVVNASGPWINSIFNGISAGQKRAQFHFAKAVNLIIPRKLSDFAFGLKDQSPPIDDYFQSNRFLFIVPWREATIIGTWYFVNSTSPDDVALTEAEYLRCIGQIQRLIPDADVQEDEVCFVHSGLVPIDLDDRNRKFEIKGQYSLIDHQRHGGPDGLISVLGVKYTTARNVAAKTADLVLKKVKHKLNKYDTGNKTLAGGEIKNIDKFIQEKKKNNYHKLTDETITHLALNYGINSDDIEKLISNNSELGELIPGSDEAIKAELPYCLEKEFVHHLPDFILRRTGIGSVKKPEEEAINYCADFMSKERGWSESQKQSEIESLLNFYNRFPLNS
jgi:glycerol-3-phosphate dehydrogenase